MFLFVFLHLCILIFSSSLDWFDPENSSICKTIVESQLVGTKRLNCQIQLIKMVPHKRTEIGMMFYLLSILVEMKCWHTFDITESGHILEERKREWRSGLNRFFSLPFDDKHL